MFHGKQNITPRAKKVIDIEALLIWAVCREFAHIHAETSGLHEVEAAAAGEPWQRSSADGCVAVARIAGLGCRPDGGIGLAGGHCHLDAETAFVTAKRVLQAPDFFLVINYARSNDRPSWGAHIKPIEARPLELSWDLRPLVLQAGNKKNAPKYCPLRYTRCGDGSVVYTVRESEIMAARMFYRTWWMALARLANHLRNEAKLTHHDVTGPCAPEYPWESPADGNVNGAE